MSAADPGEQRRRQRCRTLVFAAALGVVLATISVVDRAWPGVVVGLVGAAITIVLYRRECAQRDPGTPSAQS